MRKAILLLIMQGLSIPVLADIEVDKDAGTCAGYLATRGMKLGVETAISMADNQKRAIQFADNWLNDIERHKNDDSHIRVKVFSADSACRRVGIRPADFKK